tara:strand:- start:10094 stop:11014 length:921 start_codon:yes stop_codon:yes gene_type:complete
MTPEQAIWTEVLYAAVTDAIEGVASVGYSGDTSRANATERARSYITTPNADFNQVCTMAGLDPVAVREHVSRKIANAPTPAELAVINHTLVQTLTHNGQTHSIAEWSTITGVSGEAIRKRIKNGWTVEDTLATAVGQRIKAAPKAPHRPAQTLTHNGQTRTIIEWANVIGVAHTTIHMRLRKGWSIEAALTPKPKHEPKPKRARRTFVTLTYQGRTLKLAEWAKIVGVSLPTLCQRRKHGWTVEAMLSTPLTKRADTATQLARRGLTADDAQTPGVPSNLRPLQETGGGTFAQEIVNLNFSQDCAA